jgi:rubrerythrin
MRTPEDLRAFQEELARREQSHEWGFLAYYESLVLPLCE